MIDYNMTVSVAFESLRIIYGEMSEKDAEQFMKMWAPLFNNPSQEIIDYQYSVIRRKVLFRNYDIVCNSVCK